MYNLLTSRSAIIISILFALTFNGFGQTTSPKISFIDLNTHLHKEIDLSNGTLRIEVKPGHWANFSSVKLENVEVANLPKDLSFNVLESSNGHLLNVSGTGLVYHLDPKLKSLSRIDNTFFRGFNFHAYTFIEEDTLFSIGGEGFWNTNSTLIYFDQKLKEWEKVQTSNKGPESFEWNFGGYSKSNRSFYVLNGIEEFKPNNFNEKSFYRLDLRSLQWKELGIINTELFDNPKSISPFRFWLDGFFIYLDGNEPNVYVLDPIKNQVLLYKGNNTLLKQGANELFRDNDKIYIYRKESNGAILDSITVNQIFDDSEVLGNLYVERSTINWSLVLYTILGITTILSLLFYTRMRKFKLMYFRANKTLNIEELPTHLLQVLKYFHTNGKEGRLSTNQMNELLEIKTNSFETTRQQRSRDLKTLNEYFLIHYNIPDAIKRQNSEKDKRQTFYSLDEKAYRLLDKFNFEKNTVN